MTPESALRRSRSPLYLQVAEILRQRIGKGRWKAGEMLPTIDALAAEFGVGRITVRQAVKLLEAEKLLAPRRGRGTTVLPQPEAPRPLRVATRLMELVEMYSGDLPVLDTLEDRVAELPDDAPGGRFNSYHLIRRTHMRDERRYCVIALYFAAPLFERYEQRLRKELALPVIMKADDVDVHTARQTMTISKCDYETADLLSLSIGDPVALVRREICDSAGRIICLADVIYRGDFIRLDMDLLA